MPYIDKNQKRSFEDCIKCFKYLTCTPGELNYVVTSICNCYLRTKGKNYAHLNDVIGVLECAKQEMYRRVVAPYEE